MIFVTVGTMYPFDRLVRAMDAWAEAHPGEEMLAQIGRGRFEPEHMRWVRWLEPGDYAAAVAGAEIVVAHAGVGSLLAAVDHGKPVVLLPRQARLGEHCNDHQVDTAASLGGQPGVRVARNEAEVADRIAEARASGNAGGVAGVPPVARADLLDRLRIFILSQRRASTRVMAVASGGGHLAELRRILPAFDGMDVFYVSVVPGPDTELSPARYYRIIDVNRNDRFRFLVILWQLARIIRYERPGVVVSTGAAPGLLALAVAKLTGSRRTIWIDSIATSERMSLSGRLARYVADAWLVQWPHLAAPGGPNYWGAVL